MYNYLAKIRAAVPLGAVFDAATNAVAALFGMSDNQLRDALKGGQTLQSLEQAHNVNAQQVHDAAQAAGLKALTDGVSAGTWTQAQADDAKLAFAVTLDSFLTGRAAQGDRTNGVPSK